MEWRAQRNDRRRYRLAANRAPIIIAIFFVTATVAPAARKAAHAEIARYVVEGMN
ncbi:MAG: hypothetical protein IPL62_13630 [Caulobacteraceae bacterium]|nr:hypothetical protein [Caulobacteraceae bacterium]